MGEATQTGGIFRRWFLAPALLGLFVMAMFGDLLFFPGDRVISALGTDISRQFYGLRAFCFDSWRNGDFPLWNPNEYGGVPALGSFQSALLYPLNWIHLLLPVNAAINWVIALHVWMGGVFFHGWMKARKLGDMPALFGATVFMFCAPHFAHVYAGHLSNICAMAWAPLIFASMERWTDGGKRSSLVAGAVAVAMQILAGHPQYVFFTAVAAGVFCCVLLVRDRRWRTAWGTAAVYGAGALLAAAQLLPGLDASAESVRSSGVARGFAAMFSLPPENFITMLAPGFFGGMAPGSYWGRCYLWEMSLFMGIASLALAGWGALRGRRGMALTAAAAALVLLVLALGAHTPVFDFLFKYVPGFSMFRGWSKFAFFAVMFLIALAAEGADALIRGESAGVRWYAAFVAACGFAMLAAFAWIRYAAGPETWAALAGKVHATRESYLPAELLSDMSLVGTWKTASGFALLLGGIVTLISAAFLFMQKHDVLPVHALMLVGCVEVAVYAGMNRASFGTGVAMEPQIRDAVARMDWDERALNLLNLDERLRIPAREIWGSDPGVLKRYAEFVFASQDLDPARASQYARFKMRSPMLRIARCGKVLLSDSSGAMVREFNDILPRASLVGGAEVCSGRFEALMKLASGKVDPVRTVLLEDDPGIAITPGDAAGVVAITKRWSDCIEMEADAARPCILLVTDPYSTGWKASGLPGSASAEYRVMPAHHAFMGIPLDAGKHRIRLEYKPASVIAGAWLSFGAWLVLLAAAAAILKRRFGTSVS